MSGASWEQAITGIGELMGVEDATVVVLPEVPAPKFNPAMVTLKTITPSVIRRAVFLTEMDGCMPPPFARVYCTR